MPHAIYWRRRLVGLHVTHLRFAGGSLRLRGDSSSDDGVQYVGEDHVAIANEGRLYLIPYRALRRVWGTRRTVRHPSMNRVLIDCIRSWIDPDVNPDCEHEIVWHTFIIRRGKEYRGAILDVNHKSGIRLRLAGNKHKWLRWNQLGAATEILE